MLSCLRRLNVPFFTVADVQLCRSSVFGGQGIINVNYMSPMFSGSLRLSGCIQKHQRSQFFGSLLNETKMCLSCFCHWFGLMIARKKFFKVFCQKEW